MSRLATFVTLGALSLSLGCSGGKQKKLEAQQKADDAKVEARAEAIAQKLAPELADRELADEAQKKAAAVKAERDQMQKDPRTFFESTGLRLSSQPSGMHSVQALTLTNKSRFAVQQVVARVDFMKDGLPTAQIPLQLTGTLPAGGTKTFAVSDNTLAGAAVQTDANDTQVSVTSVVLAPEPSQISAALSAQ